ncbi:hypothetical protein D3C71_1481270 [compost metagenome]
MHAHRQPFHLGHQRRQQLAVVQLAFAGQEQALRKAVRQCGFGGGQRAAVQLLQGGQLWQRGLVGFELAGKALGLGGVLPVPHDQRARLLKKHRLCQRLQKLRPAGERMVAHAHHAGFGDGRFGQRRQHGGGHGRGRMFGGGTASVKNIHPVPLAGQLDREQSAHKARAQNGKRRRWK